MGYFPATIMFVVGLISLAVLIPVTAELSPEIQNTMGNTVMLMIGAMIVTILMVSIVMYWRLSQADDNYTPPEAYDY